MTTITLVRHGQANTTARDEHSYDQLSALGHQQAQWLGEHLRAIEEPVMRVYAGSLRRHRETAAGMGLVPEIDPRLNELSYFGMAHIAADVHGLAHPENREEFSTHMPRLFDLWQQDALPGAPESFADFETRTRAALADIAAGAGPAVVVTSGGLIGMVMRQVMGLSMQSMAHACLAIMNTSLHQLHPVAGTPILVQFNAVPHLDRPDRRYARTHL
jgi:broad specificity phosphatase PhoE